MPDEQAARAISDITKRIHIPLVADIHFDYRLALMAIENGVQKLRINPGNIGNSERVQKVVEKAKHRQRAVHSVRQKGGRKDRALCLAPRRTGGARRQHRQAPQRLRCRTDG